MEREDIIEGVYYLPYDSNFMREIQYRLRDTVRALDLELASALLEIGADPNINPDDQFDERNHGFLHSLSLFYDCNVTLHGEKTLQMIELLLEAGADPNRAGDCNMAPIQRCTGKNQKPIKELLLKYGARPEGNVVY